ncbi:MAG: hypothetical protein QM757_11500, partial [Paludibaculum sp.]
MREGATAAIQPGGSVKDADVVAAADRLGIAMVFTEVLFGFYRVSLLT